MVASIATTQKVLNVIRHHVDEETFEKILEDLKRVPGNKSFEDTIKLLADMHKVQKEKR